VADGWKLDAIIGRGEKDFGCSMRTLYRRFKGSELFDVTTLPYKENESSTVTKKPVESKGIKEYLTIERKLIPSMKMNLAI